MPGGRVAVVTGANRGIGLEIVRQLALRDLDVVLTARDSERGAQAAGQLASRGVDVDCRELDVTRPESIHAFAAWLESSRGRCDVLVNNAGIVVDGGVSVLDVDVALVRQSMETNLYGPLLLCQRLVPMMVREGYGRVVNLSTGMGQLSEMGGRSAGYRLSKTALNALTRTLAAELAGTGVLVNCLNPGWVRTDMSGGGGTRDVEEGADTAVWLATLPDDGPTGGFFKDRRPIDW